MLAPRWFRALSRRGAHMNNSPRQAILNGQQNIAPIWSRNIAPSATAAISAGPNAMPSLYTKKEA